MDKRITAINGSYRRGCTIDSSIDTALECLKTEGFITSKINLLDKHIEFCTNCRKCTLEKVDGVRGHCPINDEMSDILWQIEESDGIILGSPINFSTVTAVMKKFIERLIVYVYWPYGGKSTPKLHLKKPTKKAILITSSACPTIVGKILMPNAFGVMKSAAKCMGAKVVGKIYLGSSGQESDQKLTDVQISRMQTAARKLI